MSGEGSDALSALGEALEFVARAPGSAGRRGVQVRRPDPRSAALLMEAAKSLRAGDLGAAGRALEAAGGLLAALGGPCMDAHAWSSIMFTRPRSWARHAGLLGVLGSAAGVEAACQAYANHLAHCVRALAKPEPTRGGLRLDRGLELALSPTPARVEAIRQAGLSLAEELGRRGLGSAWDKALADLSSERAGASAYWEAGYGCASMGGLPIFPVEGFEAPLQAALLGMRSEIESFQIRSGIGSCANPKPRAKSI